MCILIPHSAKSTVKHMTDIKSFYLFERPHVGGGRILESLDSTNTWVFPNREWLADYSVLGGCLFYFPFLSEIFISFFLSFSFFHQRFAWVHICGIFMIIKWHEVSMEGTCCLSLNKRCCSSQDNVIWQAPNHWNILDILLNTTKMEQLHHAHMTV